MSQPFPSPAQMTAVLFVQTADINLTRSDFGRRVSSRFQHDLWIKLFTNESPEERLGSATIASYTLRAQQRTGRIESSFWCGVFRDDSSPILTCPFQDL